MVVEMPIKKKMADKIKEIGMTAKILVDNNCQLTGYELAETLNRGGFRTNKGEPYKKGRGVYVVVSKAAGYYYGIGEMETARNISLAFTDVNGTCPHSYDWMTEEGDEEDTN